MQQTVCKGVCSLTHAHTDDVNATLTTLLLTHAWNKLYVALCNEYPAPLPLRLHLPACCALTTRAAIG
jgi:hypothetical protein